METLYPPLLHLILLHAKCRKIISNKYFLLVVFLWYLKLGPHHILCQFLARSTPFIFSGAGQNNADLSLKQLHQRDHGVCHALKIYLQILVDASEKAAYIIWRFWRINIYQMMLLKKKHISVDAFAEWINISWCFLRIQQI